VIKEGLLAVRTLILQRGGLNGVHHPAGISSRAPVGLQLVELLDVGLLGGGGGHLAEIPPGLPLAPGPQLEQPGTGLLAGTFGGLLVVAVEEQ